MSFLDWIEIFRGGARTDSTGRAWDGDYLIDQAVGKFNPAEHRPPLVIGHPTDDAPAFGWVEALRKVMKGGAAVLEAKFGQVAPEFEDWVRRGLYKTRSASFYPDGRLRHVGFLGAMPPAVKGLAPVRFSGQEAAHFEFQEDSHTRPLSRGDKGGRQEEIRMEIKEFFEAVKALMGWAREVGVQPPAAGGAEQLEQSDLEAEVKAAAAKARAEAEAETRNKLEAEFAEKQAKVAAEARKAELKGKVTALVEAGKIAPAFAERLAEVVVLADQGAKIEFAEGKSGSPADWLIQELEQAGVSPLFSEVASRGRAGNAGAFAEAKAEAEAGRRIADPNYGKEGK